MNLWFSTYRKKGDDRSSPLILDFANIDEAVEPKSPLEECAGAIEKIVAEHSAPYTLLCSGGVDSQALIFAWQQSNVPFNVVHYSYGSNMDDTESLLAFCSSISINLQIRHFDVDAFINSSEYIEMAKRYDVASPHILTYIKFASLHNETCICAGNFLHELSPALNWTQLSLDRFRLLDKKNFVPLFFQSTPNLAYSFMRTEKRIMTNRQFYIPTAVFEDVAYSAKVLTYVTNGFPILRQERKLTGFEQIKESYDSIKIDRKLKMKWGRMPSKRTFDILFRYELFDKIPLGFYSEDVTVIHNDFINILCISKEE